MATRKQKAEPAERTEICKNCRHVSVKRGEEIQCRRFPPEFVYDPSSGCTAVMHPIVDADHWCGEFGAYLNS